MRETRKSDGVKHVNGIHMIFCFREPFLFIFIFSTMQCPCIDLNRRKNDHMKFNVKNYEYIMPYFSYIVAVNLGHEGNQSIRRKP